MEQKFIYLPDMGLLVAISEIRHCDGVKLYLKGDDDSYFVVSKNDFKILLVELTNGKWKF